MHQLRTLPDVKNPSTDSQAAGACNIACSKRRAAARLSIALGLAMAALCLSAVIGCGKSSDHSTGGADPESHHTFENVASALPNSNADNPAAHNDLHYGGGIAKRDTGGGGAFQPRNVSPAMESPAPPAIAKRDIPLPVGEESPEAAAPVLEPAIENFPVNPLRAGSRASSTLRTAPRLAPAGDAPMAVRSFSHAPNLVGEGAPKPPGDEEFSAAAAGPAAPQPTVAMRSMPAAEMAAEATPDEEPLDLYPHSYSHSAAEAASGDPSFDSVEMPPAAAGEHLAADEEADDADFTTVKVFYGTDRRAAGDLAAGAWPSWISLAAPAGFGLLAMLLLAGALASSRPGMLGVMAAVCGLAALALAYPAAVKMIPGSGGVAKTGVKYGNERGELQVGVCEVTIPKDHRVGELEAPSILRLEVHENEKKHVVLRSVERQPEDTFYNELRDCVAQAEHSEIFIFVHGYNVSFDDAARRTAQIAYDLKFEGAPVFYSWPSQGGLLKYTIDENNVQWTTPHLKQFLLDVVRRSDAKAVNLIAHSMGSRAMTSALREIHLELRDESRLFNEVVLAAPDIDAEIFRRDIAPAIVQTGKRVTLYASSNDQALIVSRQVHGHPRAGDSGEGLVLIPGIDTIDVSDVDTSLLGHSYYGSSDTILADMYTLFHDPAPAYSRRWLRPMLRDGLTYFVFHAANPTTAVRPILSPR